MELQIQKKDGRLEAFDRNKVLAGIVKSGALTEEAESITVQIETWAQDAAQNGVIGVLEIRGKVLEILRSVNPEAAARFESYQKPQG